MGSPNQHGSRSLEEQTTKGGKIDPADRDVNIMFFVRGFRGICNCNQVSNSLVGLRI